jgi:hypothetical protein
MSHTLFRALAIGAATLTATLLTLASYASADTRECTPARSGCASFHTKGDKFYVCDYAVDDMSVVVKYRRHYSKTWHTATNYLGPHKYNGCVKKTRNTKEHTGVWWKVCLAVHGRPGGKRMRIISSSCSPTAYDHF